MATKPKLLEMKNIVKTFPGVKALRGVDFDMVEGAIIIIAVIIDMRNNAPKK